ncbi:glutathione S-transferase family protein [Pararhodobacter sp. CCB-MM2]|uniref:glutathione S-transferase family protein n=1 Tax=Pararhodobacter sp. CCB-MM2 TaxID=1786003 RepID=UPI00082BD632|nr:glutathione S-transferase family protein [Pararhodobacter sp. CCB-MM2]
MIRFYTNPRSRGAIVRWMLEEVGQPYETQILDYGTTMKAPEYLALNPMGKVPAIVHDGVVVTEGAAICTYLAETFPEAGLAPTATERGAYYRWMFFGAGPVEAAVTNKALGVQVPPERKGAVGYGSLEEVVATLEGRLADSAYFAGDRFTAVDVYTGSQIGWGMMFGTLPKIAAFTDYWDRLKDRPARLAAVEKDS